MTSSALLGMLRSFLSLTISQNFLVETILWRTVVYFLILILIVATMQLNQKEKEVDRPYLVLVFGPPASGKTTFARLLHSSYQNHCQKSGIDLASLVVSADCVEEFLRHHTLQDLLDAADSRQEMGKMMQLELKRSVFIQKNWKDSRQFIKDHLPKWLKNNRLVVIEDDMLLKSQRKHIRHIAESQKPFYLEIFMEATLQQCIFNLQKREQTQQKEYQLNLQKCKQAFSKFQPDDHQYLLSVKQKQETNWLKISSLMKIVTIHHPELQEKQIASSENLAKDDVEITIRKFVSEIISNQELRKKYFKDLDTKKVASLASTIKKRYTSKIKTFQGFIDFFQNETSSYR